MSLCTRHLHISHNAPYLPPQKILHSLCFSCLLAITAVPTEIENNAYAKFWGTNKVVDVQVAYDWYKQFFLFLVSPISFLLIGQRANHEKDTHHPIST